METEVTTTDQVTGQEPQQESQTDSNVDYKALYLDEVNNSKKLRKRSQEAEAKVAEFTKAQEANKVIQMKEQEKFQELSEELQKQLDSTLPYKEKWEAHETAQREKYLSKLPKADRDKMANEKLETLEYITNMLPSEDSTSEPPKHTPGKSRNVGNGINEDWTSLSGKEGKDNYERYLNHLVKNKK
tara:strand:- start:1870 stop:2427 length:558 start_codon:yes stop_codon:yes gene_type:complete